MGKFLLKTHIHIWAIQRRVKLLLRTKFFLVKSAHRPHSIGICTVAKIIKVHTFIKHYAISNIGKYAQQLYKTSPNNEHEGVNPQLSRKHPTLLLAVPCFLWDTDSLGYHTSRKPPQKFMLLVSSSSSFHLNYHNTSKWQNEVIISNLWICKHKRRQIRRK